MVATNAILPESNLNIVTNRGFLEIGVDIFLLAEFFKDISPCLFFCIRFTIHDTVGPVNMNMMYPTMPSSKTHMNNILSSYELKQPKSSAFPPHEQNHLAIIYNLRFASYHLLV
jgi:hypothetical protein